MPCCLIQLARFKVIGVKFVGILTTRIYYQLKKSLNMFKERFSESTSRKCFLPAVNLLIFMAQRPNMAVLSESEVRAKFTRIL